MTCILLSRDIGGVFIDVVISENHTSEMEIAKHPVERGAEISDHAWRKGRSVAVEGLIDQGRAFSSFQALHALQDKVSLFTLVTGLKVYPNMICRSVEAERNAEYGRVLKFTATCEEIILVETQSSSTSKGESGTSQKTGDSDSSRAKSQVSRGNVSTKNITSPTPSTEALFESVQR
jgi:hypothetical protein